MDIVVWMPEDDAGLEKELRQTGLSVEKFHSGNLPKKVAVLNGFLVQADNHRLGYWDPCLWKWSQVLLPFWKRPFTAAMERGARTIASTRLYDALRRLEAKWLSLAKWNSEYGPLLDHARPDLILSTNPFNLHEICMCTLARRNGVPTMGAIVSWDNLCYKGHLWSEHDAYIVWGPSMEADLRRHLPALTAEQIITTGSPQFDFHKRKDLEWSREEFFQKVGGDPRRPMIVHAANTECHFPDEPAVVAGLWKSIREGAVRGNPQLLIRLHPLDTTSRFEAAKQQCPDLLIQRSISSTNNHRMWFTPDLDDLALLSNTLRHSDVTVNFASSMTLDAAILDRPVVNVAFSTSPGERRCRRIPYGHLSAHYRRVAESGAVKIAYSMEELVRWINRYLADPSHEREERRALVDSICGPVDGGSIRRIADALSLRMGVSLPPAGRMTRPADPVERPA